MWEAAAVAFATFFATVGPFDVGAVYAALSAKLTPVEKRRAAFRGALLAGLILLIFAAAGEALLRGLGISPPAFRAAGGVLLLLIGVDLVFARESGVGSTTPAENRDAAERRDLAVFPVAMPLIAGPGTMGAVILHISDAEGDLLRQAAVLGALALVLLITLASMLLANQLHRLLGVTGMNVISRVFGVLLTAMAVQFIFDGLRESGVFG